MLKDLDDVFPKRVMLKIRFDLVAGLSDGILTALTLAAGTILNPASSISISIALRVGAFSAITGMFIFFIARYEDLRIELVEAERQLNLTSHGRFASSRLGRTVLLEAAQSALVVGSSSFCGALLPLAIGAFLPGWVALAAALAILLLLGIFLAKVVYGNPIRWAIGLSIGGVILTYVGMRLNII